MSGSKLSGFLVVSLFLTASARAAERIVTTQATRTHLLELCTSEGTRWKCVFSQAQPQLRAARLPRGLRKPARSSQFNQSAIGCHEVNRVLPIRPTGCGLTSVNFHEES
jgi:hypothetical protein